MSTWQWREICFRPHRRLIGHGFDDVRKRDSTIQSFRHHVSTRIRRRLKTDSGDPRPLDSKLDQSPDLMIIHAWLNSADQNCIQPHVAKLFDGLQLGLQKTGPAE